MRKLSMLIGVLILAGLPSTLIAKQEHEVQSLNIRTIYIAASAIHGDDRAGYFDLGRIRYTLQNVMGWKITKQLSSANAILIVVPHSYGETDTPFCTYLSIEVAVPVGKSAKRTARIVWGNEMKTNGTMDGDGGLASQHQTGGSIDRDIALNIALKNLCASDGIASKRKCGHLINKAEDGYLKSLPPVGAPVVKIP